MGHRDSVYRLSELIEVDDALVRGRLSGESAGAGQKEKRRSWWQWKTVVNGLDLWPCKRWMLSIKTVCATLSIDTSHWAIGTE